MPKRSSQPLKRLRARAEARLTKSIPASPAAATIDPQKLVYELQVHQTELELQNDELRRVLLDLGTARDRFSTIYDLASVGYVTLNAEGEIHEANLTAAALLAHDREYLKGRKFNQFVIREDQDRFYLHQEEVYLSQTKKTCELQMVRRDGKPIPIQLESVAIHDREDFRQECLVALSDISERRRMEAERTQMAAIVESSNDAIISRALDDTILSWNRGAEQMFGYTAAEIVGRSFAMLLLPEDCKEHDQILQAVTAGGKLDHYEAVGVAKDGRKIVISATISPVKDARGTIIGISTIARDIGRQREAEEVIRRSERNLSDFFNESPLGLLWVDPGGRIIRTNRAFLELLGYTTAETLGRMISGFHVDLEVAVEVQAQLAKKETLQNYRARLRDKAGSIKHVLIDANGLWEGGQFVHSRWFIRDITRRMELEREILAISDREQRRIGRDLHDDLGQQLAGIEFLAQSLTSRLATISRPVASQAGQVALMARQAMVHARELARGLSPIGIESDGLMIALRQLAARTKQIFRVDCRFRCRSPVLIKDQEIGAHLYRIAQEAVSNAIKHGKARRIDIGLALTGKRIVLAISDNGIGLPKRPPKKRGMGLRVMQYRAGVIGGSLVVQRQPDGGTTFVCTIKHQLVEPDPSKEKKK